MCCWSIDPDIAILSRSHLQQQEQRCDRHLTVLLSFACSSSSDIAHEFDVLHECGDRSHACE
jgi:hypothetical protein